MTEIVQYILHWCKKRIIFPASLASDRIYDFQMSTWANILQLTFMARSLLETEVIHLVWFDFIVRSVIIYCQLDFWKGDCYESVNPTLVFIRSEIRVSGEQQSFLEVYTKMCYDLHRYLLKI